MDPIIEEIRRVGDPASIQRHALRRWQDELLYRIQPLLDKAIAYELAEQQQAKGKAVKA